MRLPIGLLIVVILWGFSAARAQTSPIEAFFGSYDGTASSDAGTFGNLDLTVIIRPFDEDGFLVQ